MPVYFNGGTQPLVPEGRWGEGVIMPGERYETEAVLGPPWVIDAEAEAALAATNPAVVSPPPAPPVAVPSDSSTEVASAPQDAPQDPSDVVVSAADPAASETPNQESK